MNVENDFNSDQYADGLETSGDELEPKSLQQTENESSKFQIWLSIAVAIGLAVLPDLYNGIVGYFYLGEPETVWNFNLFMGQLLFRSIQVSVVILYLVYLLKMEWSAVGLTKFKLPHDVLWALLVWFLATVLCYWLMSIMPDSFFPKGVEGGEETNKTTFSIILLLIAHIANAFAEELAIRGFLFVQLEKVTGPIRALLITSVLFASYHIYQDVGPTLSILLFGIIYGIFFCLLRRLWPLIIAHTLSNWLYEFST